LSLRKQEGMTMMTLSKRRSENQDPLLDRFMPVYDIAERHHIRLDVVSPGILAIRG
jgi:hypothetical protein